MDDREGRKKRLEDRVGRKGRIGRKDKLNGLALLITPGPEVIRQIEPRIHNSVYLYSAERTTDS